MVKEPKTVEEINLKLAYLEGERAGYKRGFEEAMALLKGKK